LSKEHTMCESVKGCIQGFAKIILILINVIALLAGIALIGVGSYTVVKGSDFLPDVGVSMTPAAVCLIVLGVLLFFIGCFGCFGAVTGKHSLLNIYLILLGIIVILEVAVFIYGLVNRKKVKGKLETAIKESFENVNVNGTTKAAEDYKIVNALQKHAECCGIKGPAFWTPPTFKKGTVPASCCKDAAEDAKTCAIADAYKDGCLDITQNLVGEAMTALIVALVVIVVFQLICMVLAWCSRGDYTEVKA